MISRVEARGARKNDRAVLGKKESKRFSAQNFVTVVTDEVGHGSSINPLRQPLRAKIFS